MTRSFAGRHAFAPARVLAAALSVSLLLALPVSTTAFAATITIVNNDGAGEGFNDTTPVSPIGGNPGTTLGAQRLFIFQHAAAIWGNILPSDVTILVRAQFNPQTCSATTGVLGSAGSTTIHSDFPGALVANTWYNQALANRLSGSDLDPANPDINATFNSDVDNSTCLGETNWYYGIDGDDGTDIELLPVLLHELGHGLGFQTFADNSTGRWFSNYNMPDIFGSNLFDKSSGLAWPDMTNNQRKASATDTGNLVWNGSYVTSSAPNVLAHDPVVEVLAPATIDGYYTAAEAEFGPPVSSPGVTADVVLIQDGTPPINDGCEAIVNGAALAGKIVLVDRGLCNFTVKVATAQAYGAVGVIVANNAAGAPASMGGVDPSITIPSLMVSQADGTTMKNALLAGTVTARIGRHPTLLAGAHPDGQVRMYAPSPLEPGSSVSHFDDTAFPDILMEPAINSGLHDTVDLTHQLFVDIGWLGGVTAVAGNGPSSPGFRVRSAPNPFDPSTVISLSLPNSGATRVEVYDIQGRLVKRLVNTWLPAGNHAVTWDGTNAQGRTVGSGVYFTRIESNGLKTGQRLVKLND